MESRSERPKKLRLTPRQRQVAKLLSEGLTYAAISRRLGISRVRAREVAIRVRILKNDNKFKLTHYPKAKNT